MFYRPTKRNFYIYLLVMWVMVRFAENYLDTHHVRAKSFLIAEEISTISSLIGKIGIADPNLLTQQKLLEIEHHLTKAHELFFKRQYQESIKEYKLAQGLIYQILDPGFRKDLSIRPEIKFPLNKELFSPLIAGSLDFIEAISPEGIESFVSAPFVEIPRDAVAALDIYPQAGVKAVDNVDRFVRYDAELGSMYAERNQWKRAEYFYSRARANLGTPQTPEQKLALASLDLNLSAIYIQTNRTTEAKTLAQESLNIFKETNDTVGETQANFNIAAAFTKEGSPEQAKPFLEEGSKRIEQIPGMARVTNTFTPTSVSTTSPSSSSATTTPSAVIRPSLSVSRVPRDIDHLEARVFPRTISATTPGSIKPDTLKDLSDAGGTAVTFRHLGKGQGWLNQTLETTVEAGERTYTKELGLIIGNQLQKFQWNSGDALPINQIVDNVYTQRINNAKFEEINWKYYIPTDFASQLPHIYYYVIPISLGDCYHALGEYETAESYYMKAADYEYLNMNIETPFLWQKIADNVLAWGDLLYRSEEYQDAMNVYRKVLEPPGSAEIVWADSPLYKHSKLSLVGEKVKAMLANHETAGIGDMNSTLAAIVLEVRARLLQLSAGLDFLGLSTAIVPIWSFDYLQNVSRYFTQQAIQAEREFINFWDRAEDEALMRQQLEQAVTLSDAEQELTRRQREAAEAEQGVYEEGQKLAAQRKENANDNKEDYENMSEYRIWIDAVIAAHSGHSDAYYTEIAALADQIRSGSWHGEAGKLTAAATLIRGQISRDYELAAMDRQIAELQQAEKMAQEQVVAAAARVRAAQQMEEVARLRKEAAQESLSTFDNQFFTPDVWYRMGSFMKRISQSYLNMAIKVARLMQRAYNFENDVNRKFIKVDYSIDTVKGMLGGDALLLDIDSFTYDLITTVKRKQIPIKQTISVAERYPFLFETQFRRNGRIEFETRMEDFDFAYPGTFGGRIENIEVEVEGIMPRSGVRGTLTNSGISRYRTADSNQINFRVQSKETLVLSEYRIKDDAIVFPADPRLLKIFESAGVASTWALEIPKSTNDIDFNSITNISITFYYHARYDETLASAVKSKLASFAGINRRSRTIPTRWIFPDSFFHFQDTGKLAFSLDTFYFPFNEVNPQIRKIALLLIAEPSLDPSGWKIRLTVPENPNATTTPAASPNSQGEISVTEGHPWQTLANGSAVGNYLVEIRADENPGLVENGALKLDQIRNIVLILEYEYEPRT